MVVVIPGVNQLVSLGVHPGLTAVIVVSVAGPGPRATREQHSGKSKVAQLHEALAIARQHELNWKTIENVIMTLGLS